MNTFKQVNPKQSFPELEKNILKFWKEEKIFKQSIENRKDSEEFEFYDGPPFATGLPHYGHILAGTIKDIIPRYKTMQGFKVDRKFGWDCHGLPVENLIEKKLGLANKQELMDYGIGKFNEECRGSVLKYTSEWKETVEKMGRWVEFEGGYKTMDPDFMESVWATFKAIWDKGMVYEGNKPMHICPRCVTPLSNFEVNQGYKDLTDISVVGKFRINNNKCEHEIDFLAWTTTPWTLPGNVALAVGAGIEYSFMKKGNHVYVLATDTLKNFEKELEGYELLHTRLGSQLVQAGLKYDPIFDYYKNEAENGAFGIVIGDFVTTDSGTGIVHIAPAFGEDDMKLGKENNLPFIQHVGMDGKFTKQIQKDFGENPVKEASDNMKIDREIVKFLEEKGKVFNKKNLRHSYPTCWRCDTPLLNYATKTWFIAVEKIKDKLIKNNKKINWTPKHLQEGRFGKWLEGARDWAVSRNRYWGTPLPIWKNNETGNFKCIGTIAELEKLTGKKVPDLHKHKIDDLTFKLDGEKGEYKRVEEVFDCWFESGSMPYAQKHYLHNATSPHPSPLPEGEGIILPFKLPADFIAEGLDQTRGWFYTLHVISTILFDKPAFKNVIVNGIVLAEDGQKMSKSKQNYPDPNLMIEKYGADTIRFYLMNSPVVYGENFRFSEKGLEEITKSVLLPLWNSYSFFTMYANIDGYKIAPGGQQDNTPPGAELTNLDKWILSELELAQKKITENMDNYSLSGATKIFSKFFDNITNWYIRRSRKRFWSKAGGQDQNDKQVAYDTLHYVLVETSKMLAPFCPFISEEIFKNLTGKKSVHLEDWTKISSKFIDEKLSEKIETTQKIIQLGLGLRKKLKLKVRQPLQKAIIAMPDIDISDQFETIKEELNVKELEFLTDPSEIAEISVLPNAKILGPRFGKKVQEIIQNAKTGNYKKLENSDNIEVCGEILTPDEIAIRYQGKDGKEVNAEGELVVALDTEITPELKLEGLARDIIRQVAEMRKEAGYNITDRISIEISDKNIQEKFGEIINQETLSSFEEIGNPDSEGEVEGVGIKIFRKK